MYSINKYLLRIASLGILLLTFCQKHGTLNAQTNENFAPLGVLPQPQVALQPKHSLGWGLSAAVGDINRGDDRGDFLFSMFYQHQITPTSDIEAALHYIAVHKLGGIDGFVFQDSSKFVKISWQSDCAWNVQPFDGVFKNLRFGVGLSFRYITSTVVAGKIPTAPIPLLLRRNPNGSLDTLASAPLFFRQQSLFQGLALGAVLRVEYVFPLSSTIDVIVRTQLHSYLPPMISAGTASDQGNSGTNIGSAGLFLRVRW